MVNLLLTFFFLSFSFQSFASYDIGIKPDCSESKVTIDDLLDIEKRPEVSTMVDFLNAIPKDSLQTFTLVNTSRSLQHHKVSWKWPRVLRSSADGKLTMSFVCNPQSQDYDRVEVMYFLDPPMAEWRTVSFDFRKAKMSYKSLSEDEIFKDMAGTRVQHNQVDCAKCHSAQGHSKNGQLNYDLRPNWPMYKIWEGVYGSDDDVLHEGTDEKKNYEKFLIHAKSDPCFQTLPWPKKKVKGYELYPYHLGFDLTDNPKKQFPIEEEVPQIKIDNYHLRPNLKFTDAYGHLMAQRLAWKFLRSDKYQSVAALMMMEAVNCDGKFIDQELESKLKGFKSPAGIYVHTDMDPRSQSSRTKRLYALGQYLNFSPSDWSMHFNDFENPFYESGIAGLNNSDTPIGRVAQGVLMDQLAKANPQLKSHYSLVRGVSDFFKGQDFSCIDDLGGAIDITSIDAQKALCQQLKRVYLSSRPLKVSSQREPLKVTGVSEANKSERQEIINRLVVDFGAEKITVKNIRRGKEEIEQNCVGCHGNKLALPRFYRFFVNSDTLSTKIKEDATFIWRAMAYIESERMPKGFTITVQQRESIQAYLLDLANQLNKQ